MVLKVIHFCSYAVKINSAIEAANNAFPNIPLCNYNGLTQLGTKLVEQNKTMELNCMRITLAEHENRHDGDLF